MAAVFADMKIHSFTGVSPRCGPCAQNRVSACYANCSPWERKDVRHRIYNGKRKPSAKYLKPRKETAKEKMERRRVRELLVWLAACLIPFVMISATDATFDCPDIDNAVVHHMPIQLPPTVVPALKSARKCTDLHFRPPVNTSYLDHRLIAFKSTAPPPSDLVTRMLLYGCEGEREDVLTHDCVDPKAMGQCQVIGSWTPGSLGDCFHLNSGIPFGKKGFASFTLEVRWSNPALTKDKVDSPGMLLYFTPQLRQFDSSTFKLGNDYVDIAPQSPASSVTSSCTSTCTRAILQQDIYVTAVISLMNDLGTRQSVELHRDGRLLQNLMNVALAPDKKSRGGITQVKFHDPIQVKPGDVITTTCHYSSTNTTVTGAFNTNGAPHEDETCYAYLRFHPANAASSLRPSCVSWKTALACNSDIESGCTQKQREKFHHGNLPNTGFYKSIVDKCPVFGVCTRACKAAVLEATAHEPCMANEEHWFQIKTTMLAQDQFGRQFLSAMASCELEIFKDSLAKLGKQREPAETIAAGPAVVQPKDEKMTMKGAVLKKKGVVMRRKYVCSAASKTSVYSVAFLLCLLVILDLTA